MQQLGTTRNNDYDAQFLFVKMLVRSNHHISIALVAHNVLYEAMPAIQGPTRKHTVYKTPITCIGLPDAPIAQGVDERASWPRA